jgi:hypothetical protein
MHPRGPTLDPTLRERFPQSFVTAPAYPGRDCFILHWFISARFFLAEFLESGIGAQWIPEWIES